MCGGHHRVDDLVCRPAFVEMKTAAEGDHAFVVQDTDMGFTGMPAIVGSGIPSIFLYETVVPAIRSRSTPLNPDPSTIAQSRSPPAF